MANPEGKYKNVNVIPITGTGSLSNGTGTLSSFGVFSCGDFGKDDLPEVTKIYNINGVLESNGQTYQFPGWNCVSAGKTSDFKA